MSIFENKKAQYFLLFIVALFVFYPSFIYPFMDIDELLWGEFANAVLKRCPPYVCVLGEKPPLLYFFYTGVFYLFGKNNYLFIHLIHFIWILVSSALLFKISLLDERISSRFKILPSLFYILFFGLTGFRCLAATGESLMNLFFILSWLLFVTRPFQISFFKILLLGFCVGIGAHFRHQGGMQLCVFAVCLLLLSSSTHPRSLSKRVFDVFALILGFGIFWSLMMGLLHILGSWEAYKEWNFHHNVNYIAQGAKGPGVWHSSIVNGLQFLLPTSFFIFLAGIAIQRLKNVRRDVIALSSITYLVLSLLAANAGFRFYPHYFIQAFPPLALLAAEASSSLWNHKYKKFLITGMILSLLTIIGQQLFIPIHHKKYDAKDYALLNQRVGSYLKEKTSENDTLFIWGWGTGIHYYSNRGMGTRFIHSDFLSGKVSAANPQDYTIGIAKRFIYSPYWQMWLEDMKHNQPLYFLDTSPAKMHGYEYFPMENYPILKKYVEEHYIWEGEMEGVQIYRRK